MTDISMVSSPPFPPPVRRLIFAFSKSLAVNPFLSRISLTKGTSVIFTAFLSWPLSLSFPRIRAWASLAFFCSDAASSLEGASPAGLCSFPLVTCAGTVKGTARRQSDARMDGMMSLHRRFITRQANAGSRVFAPKINSTSVGRLFKTRGDYVIQRFQRTLGRAEFAASIRTHI